MKFIAVGYNIKKGAMSDANLLGTRSKHGDAVREEDTPRTNVIFHVGYCL